MIICYCTQIDGGGLTRIDGISQLLVRKNNRDQIVMIIAKVIHDFIIGGTEGYINVFLYKLKSRFQLKKIVIGDNFHFNGCKIHRKKMETSGRP